ncbi:Pleiotropic regulatory protein [Magnetospirillum sp. LM-5]|uniref:DegT/DnrJ/EryC1/StrS family aminotransferase n=1 Tax=Magnetospirillum sp. LM-5 TaxID=2681466 RepID=UPI001380FA0F|nr:DegT/DnrJ/EryC1/StrS family aminotransferase [Magnetospirillum sp. LM-5]CAA7615874.1 Pleiotropic regulatory protein [Magnetospirillum sp. LM-5]
MTSKVRYSYLAEQFADPTAFLDAIKAVVQRGDFTLGEAVGRFEARFAALIGSRHAIGVNSGTDAIKLALKAVGIGPGDEVVTAANTFIATVGAIAETGATPVLVDCESDRYVMDVKATEAAVTPRTKAIVPVQLTGDMVDMAAIMDIAQRHGLAVVEDSCQAIHAAQNGRPAGTWGAAGTFSLHPLKNLNVWGDGGVIVTDDDDLAARLRLLRNHGLAHRDEVVTLGCNSRLDTIQAAIGLLMVDDVPASVDGRIANAARYDAALADIGQIRLPRRRADTRQNYHLYMVFAEERDALVRHLNDQGISAKIHYPVPLYRQPGLAHLGYAAGDFPHSDAQAASVLSLPIDPYLTPAMQDTAVAAIRQFYGRG